MEDRNDLEEILLRGLDPQERQQTIHSIQRMTVQKLEKLRQQPNETIGVSEGESG